MTVPHGPACDWSPPSFVVRYGDRLAFYATAREAVAAMVREASTSGRAEVGFIKAGVFEAICYEEVKP